MDARGYQALEDFGVRHYRVVSEKLGLTVTRLPSDTTFRRILQKLNFQVLANQFEQWVSQAISIQAQEWVAIDGKSIEGTVTEAGTAYQNFVTLVSVYPSFVTLGKALSFMNPKTLVLAAIAFLLSRKN